jgi:hypothetical protein
MGHDNGVYEISHFKVCPNCGKQTGRFTETLYLEPGEEYTGNSRVLSKTMPYENSSRQGCTEVRITRDQFRDFNYGNFCTLDCCRRFANTIWNSDPETSGRVLNQFRYLHRNLVAKVRRRLENAA